MRRATYPLALSSLLVTALLGGPIACGPTPDGDGGITNPDGGVPPGGDGGQDPDGGTDPDPDGGTDPGPGGPTVTACEGAPQVEPGTETCVVQSGTSGTLLVGDVLVPGTVYEQGAVLLDDNGVIQCVGCGCFEQAANATQVICPDAVISPGLINAHDHVGWMNNGPFVPGDGNSVDPAERYEHRHDWRRGKRGHTNIQQYFEGSANNDEKAYGELRFILGGATSVFGSGNAPGLMRNLDSFGDNEDLGRPSALYETFPLNDSSGFLASSGCTYNEIDGPQDWNAWGPHVSEGIDAEARNEFLCLTGQQEGAQDSIQANTAIIHGIALRPSDIALMASRGAKLIWSPRTNISLYGDTAAVTLYDRLGVNIGLGTDWMPSGSMNMLRELRCADELNSRNFGGYFSDEQLWLMATQGSARALGVDDAIGILAPGRKGDIAVFANNGRRHHRAILDATPGDVALVLRAGEVLSGDANVVDALESNCDVVSDVCGSDKRVCLSREIGKSYQQLLNDVGDLYALFTCDVPENEPSCVPARTLEGDIVNGSNLFEGMSVEGDRDGDGVPDGQDNCPDIFNPIRPVDDGAQADGDADQVGDVCDPCPLNADTTECTTVDPDDLDGDGVPAADDNCPNVANPEQADSDDDGKGNECDACPDYANAGDAGCLMAVSDIKTDTSLVDERVALEDLVVTGVLGNGFFAQAEAGSGADHSGIFVYTGAAPEVALWDVVDVTGATVSVFFNQVQLTDVTLGDAPRAGEPVAPRSLSHDDIAAAVAAGAASPLEGLLVEVTDVTVTNPTPAAGGGDDGVNEFEITGGFRVDDAIFLIDPQPVQDESFARITGPLAWRNDHLKLLPRSADDVAAGESEVVSFGPAPVFVRVGGTGALGTELVVEVARNVAADLVVEITSDDPTIATVTGGTVTIPAGARSAIVPVTGVAAGTTTLRASRQGSDVEVAALVQVLAADAQPTLAAVAPETLALALEQSTQVTVTLDIPAPAGGVEVAIAVDGGVGSAPASVTVPADAREASFTFEAAAAEATGSVDVTLGDTTLSVAVEVRDGPPDVDFVETFDTSSAGGGYGDGSFTGVGGVEWSYVHARNEDTFPIDGAGLLLRRADEPSSLSGTLPNGVGYLAVDVRKAYTGGSTRAIEVLVGGVTVARVDDLGFAGSGTADDTVYVLEVPGINVAGPAEVVIRVPADLPDGNRQMVIDNVRWTSFGN